MSGVVHLARHGSHAEVGQVLSGRSAIELSAAGRAEAKRLAARLADVPLRAIWSSPRARARETAAIVAEAHGMTVGVADALDEIDFGGWTGMRFNALAGDPRWQAWNADRKNVTPPDGEGMDEAVARAQGFIEDQGEGPVLHVSHCDIIRGLVARAIGLPIARMLGFDCDPASLTTLHLHDGGAQLVTLNERPR